VKKSRRNSWASLAWNPSTRLRFDLESHTCPPTQKASRTEHQAFVTPPCLFTGNPGTGRTALARFVGRAYRPLAVLSKGHLVEVDRSALVAGYVGHTALKTKEVVQRALDEVLFIDEEAYALVGDSKDFGPEAINTLLKLTEDYRIGSLSSSQATRNE